MSRVNEEETVLVRRLRAEEPAALNEMIRIYRPRIRLVAMRILRNEADAEEITADVMLNAWRKISQFRGDASFSTWLITMTRNRCFNRFHHNRRRGSQVSVSLQTGPEHGTGTLADVVASPGLSVSREIEIAEFNEVVAATMNKLAPKEREILTLMRGYTYNEIADMLRIEFGTVKSRIARAREHLRELLDERAPQLCDLRPERVA